jgi:hypothetical protein
LTCSETTGSLQVRGGLFKDDELINGLPELSLELDYLGLHGFEITGLGFISLVELAVI